MEVNYQKYQYHIAIPPFNKHTHRQLYSQVIPYWKKFWTELLKEINSKEGLQEDEFYWQDRITYITHADQIVAAHFIACYKMSEFSRSDYAKRYLTEDVAASYDGKSGFINTLQYLSVDPSYNYRKARINFAGILMDMCKSHQYELQAQQTITVARKLVGAHNLARKFGFQELCTIKMHGENSKIMLNNTPKRHPQKIVRNISNYFWKERKILINKEH